MADRYYNRDRNRPYDEDFNEDFYNQENRSRGRYDRDFDYRRDYGMRNRSYGSSGESDFGGENRFNDRKWGDMNRGGYGNYGRGSSSYGRNYGGSYDSRGMGTGGYTGGYGRGYGSEGTGYGRNYGESRGMNTNRYSSGFGSMDYSSDYDSDFDTEFDYDYDFDTMPTSWSYQEIWLIPGPFSGIGPQGYQRSDERIREDINERLTQHGRLNARDIQAEVKDGEATITGTVESRQAKRIAEDIVESVTGIKDVHNQLRVQERQRSTLGQQSQQSMGQQQGQSQTMSQQEREGERNRS